MDFSVELTPHGAHSRVLLNGLDISNYVQDIDINSGAQDATRVTISFINVTVNRIADDKPK